MRLIMDTVAAMANVVATIDGLDGEFSSDAISIRSLLKSDKCVELRGPQLISSTASPTNMWANIRRFCPV